ncbi:hypothetical protein [Novosphingobium naphthalenivorans]|uniref:hypothetical protein n=1 Tax=Novosphingobium naphthalenivorans TaxID=273168 RepID=UPI000ADFF7BE|nr:hypothetical protein [Novosphingobium naphthalenivorans]
MPSRMLIGLMLVIPYGKRLPELLTVCDCGPACGQSVRILCAGIGVAEIVLGGSLIVGALVRLAGWLAVADFGARALAGFAASFVGEGSTVAGIEAYGDWVWGAVYLGAVTLLLDIIGVGGGKFSLDRVIYEWLHRGFKRAP